MPCVPLLDRQFAPPRWEYGTRQPRRLCPSSHATSPGKLLPSFLNHYCHEGGWEWPWSRAPETVHRQSRLLPPDHADRDECILHQRLLNLIDSSVIRKPAGRGWIIGHVNTRFSRRPGFGSPGACICPRLEKADVAGAASCALMRTVSFFPVPGEIPRRTQDFSDWWGCGTAAAAGAGDAVAVTQPRLAEKQPALSAPP